MTKTYLHQLGFVMRDNAPPPSIEVLTEYIDKLVGTNPLVQEFWVDAPVAT